MCRKNTKSLQRFYILHFTCNVFLNTNRTNLTNYYSCYSCYSCSYNYDYSLNTNRTYLTNYYSCHSCYSCSYNYDYSLNTNRTYLTNYYSCHSCYSCSYNYDYSLNTNRTYLTNYYSCYSCGSCSKVIIRGCLTDTKAVARSRMECLMRYSATVLQCYSWDYGCPFLDVQSIKYLILKFLTDRNPDKC